MEKKIISHVVFVLDHSGSMHRISDEAKENFNEQLTLLKKEAHDQEIFVTLVEFDSYIKTVFTDIPVDKVKPLKKYWVGDMTALNDAIAYGIENLSHIEELNDPESGHSALIIVITDGLENKSSDFAGKKGVKRLKSIIEAKETIGTWTFTFLGANLDIQATAVRGLSFDTNNAMGFDATVSGMNNAKETIKCGLTSYFSLRRSGATSTKNFYNIPEDVSDGSK